MGVVTVEKHVFYLVSEDTTATVADPKGLRGETKDITRRNVYLRTMRLPWNGLPSKTIGYIHDAQTGAGQHKAVPPGHEGFAAYLLGKGIWGHPQLVIADVPESRLLMTFPTMARKLVEFAKQKGILSKHLKPRLPREQQHEVWLPWDPTESGKKLPNFATTVRYASGVLREPIQSGRVLGRRPTADAERPLHKANHPPGTAIIVGAAYRLKYHRIAPPDVRWLPEIQRKVMFRLRVSGVRKAGEWYAIGKYDPEDLDSRYRGRRLHTYHPGMGVVTGKRNDLMTRRLFKVTAQDHASAQRAVRAKIQAMRRVPKLQDMALDKELAWQRTSNAVISVPAWDLQMGKKARLNEESYRRLLHTRVY